MSELKGKIGKRELHWKSPPVGHTGSSQVEYDGKYHEVRWRRDDAGIWIELPHGAFGFDIQAEYQDDGRKTYKVDQRGFANSWTGLAFLRAGEEESLSAMAGKKSGLRVRAQMPGKILRVLVKPGDTVEKGQPLIVMEAMKMENEIRAHNAGRVAQVKVTEGQAVETGADLVNIEGA